MLLYLGLTVLGFLTGVFTGLVPGIHPNTVVFMSMPFYFSTEIEPLTYGSFIAGLSISHTFHDFLPAIFLSIPEAEAALSTLPGPEMAADGKGVEAFLYTVTGGAFSVIAFLIAAPMLLIGAEAAYKALTPFMEYILLFFLFFLIFKSDDLISATAITVLSGALGMLAFRVPVNQTFVLMPVFTGLFAIPSIAVTMSQELEIPEQEISYPSTLKAARGGSIGFLAGLMAGLFPGIGSATSTTFLSPMLDSRKEFLAGMGAVNTSDIMISFIAMYLLGKARSGASVALMSVTEVSNYQIGLLIGLSLIAVSLSLLLAWNIAVPYIQMLKKAGIKRASLLVLALVLCFNFYMTGWIGLLVLFTASFIGYAAVLSDQRSVCMSVLIVPAVSFYSQGLFLYL
jgi:putative membrane protein